MTVPRSIAVIGGGWAGLATAVELCAAGARVTLFESARHLGGRARSVAINGQALDNGQHILVGAYHEPLRLMRLVGAEPEKLLRCLPLDLRHPVEGFHLRLPQQARATLNVAPEAVSGADAAATTPATTTDICARAARARVG